MTPSAFIIVAVVFSIYFVIFLTLGKGESSTNTSSSTMSSSGINWMMVGIFILWVILLLVNGIKYYFGVDVLVSLKNIFVGKPEINVVVKDNNNNNIIPSTIVPEITYKEQVFNIPGNYYDYSDAKALCSAYGSRLASYQEVEDSYDKGGEWCNYGWSDGQMALFPTQTDTFNKLQKIKGHEHDCGRIGVNGGYIENPNVKFGVNCYGYKPKITSEEEEMMKNITSYPKTKKDIEMEKRVDYWKKHIDTILVSPFNNTNWSKV